MHAYIHAYMHTRLPTNIHNFRNQNFQNSRTYVFLNFQIYGNCDILKFPYFYNSGHLEIQNFKKYRNPEILLLCTITHL